VGEVTEEMIDCVSETDVKAVLTLAVALKIGSSSPSVISLPVEFAREIEMRPGSFKPKSSLADRAKSFSTLGVRKICRFLLLSDPLRGDDKGADRAVWAGELDFAGVLGEEEYPGEEETARDKVNDVEGCEATRAL